jgi:hypothetical protein
MTMKRHDSPWQDLIDRVSSLEAHNRALQNRIADLEEDIAGMIPLKSHESSTASERSERARKAWITRKANAAREAMHHE